MIEEIEVVGTLEESDHVTLEFNIMQVQVTEHRQSNVLDFKNAG